MTDTATPTALEDAEAQGIIQRNVQPTYGYYRQPDGVITVSPAGDLDQLKYMREGWEFLAQYGKFEMASARAADHPLEALYQSGGIHELTIEQILEQGLANDPDYKVPTCRELLNQYHKRHKTSCFVNARRPVFPQLAGQQPVVYPCNFCSDVKPTEAARDQHEGVMHKEEKSDIRTGTVLGDSIVKGLAGLLGKEAPGEDDADPTVEVASKVAGVMDVLADVGLNQKQLAALREAGFIKEEDTNGAN